MLEDLAWIIHKHAEQAEKDGMREAMRDAEAEIEEAERDLKRTGEKLEVAEEKIRKTRELAINIVSVIGVEKKGIDLSNLRKSA